VPRAPGGGVTSKKKSKQTTKSLCTKALDLLVAFETSKARFYHFPSATSLPPLPFLFPVAPKISVPSMMLDPFSLPCKLSVLPTTGTQSHLPPPPPPHNLVSPPSRANTTTARQAGRQANSSRLLPKSARHIPRLNAPRFCGLQAVSSPFVDGFQYGGGDRGHILSGAFSCSKFTPMVLAPHHYPGPIRGTEKVTILRRSFDGAEVGHGGMTRGLLVCWA
jgi:hypothetical protein